MWKEGWDERADDRTRDSGGGRAQKDVDKRKTVERCSYCT